MLSDLYNLSAWMVLFMGILIFGIFFSLFIIGNTIYSIFYWIIYKTKKRWNRVFTTRI